MKKTFLFLCMLLMVSMISAKENRTIDNPPFLLSNTMTSLQFTKVVLTDTSTVIKCHSKYRPKNWIRISKNSFLQANGVKYKIKSGIGINIGDMFWMPESGEAEFTLLFEPIPSDTQMFSFKEGESDDDWRIYGVNITGKKLYTKLPAGLNKVVKTNCKVEEPIITPGKATIKGCLLGLPSGECLTGNISYGDACGDVNEKITTDAQGCFSFSGNILHPTLAIVNFVGRRISFLIAPSQESEVYMNLPAISYNDIKSKQLRYYFKGYMSDFNQEMANSRISNNVALITDYDEFFKSIKDYNVDQYMEMVRAKVDNAKESIYGSKLSKAVKDYLYLKLSFNTMSLITETSGYLTDSQILAGRVKQEDFSTYMNKLDKDVDYKANMEYLSTMFQLVNKDMWHLLPNFSYAIQSFNVYSKMGLNWPAKSTKFMTDYINISALFNKMKAYTILNENDLASIDDDKVKDFVTAKNDALRKKIEDNKKKTSYRINTAGDVVNEDLFASLTNKYRGKVVLVDFWATWCGPCKMAHKTMKPLKEELKDKVVFLYLAAENSPKETWEDMIADIDGEHVRVNASQWEYLRKEFDANGVPTYLLIDKDGNVFYKSIGYPGNEVMRKKIDIVLDK